MSSSAIRSMAAVFAFCGLSQPVQAEQEQPVALAPRAAETVAIEEIIDAVAKRSKQRFLVDPRVRGEVYAPGLDVPRVSYGELQAILEIHGFAAVSERDLIRIVPQANVRSAPLPVVGKDGPPISDDEYVISIVETGRLPATSLVPILRPLLPQYAHLAAEQSSNSLLIAARWSSIKTIQEVVHALQMNAAAGVAAPIRSVSASSDDESGGDDWIDFVSVRAF